MLDLASNLAGAFLANCSESPNSSPGTQFAFSVNALQVLTNGRHGDLEQLGDQGLAEPERLVGEATLHARVSVRRLVQDDFADRLVALHHDTPYWLRAFSIPRRFRISARFVLATS